MSKAHPSNLNDDADDKMMRHTFAPLPFFGEAAVCHTRK